MDAVYTGNKIFSLRKGKNLTQKELAEKLHVTDKAVSKWERGLNYPDLTLIPMLAEVLETSVSDLLGLEQNISGSTMEVITKVAETEKKDVLRILHEYLELTIILGVVVIFHIFYIFNFGYTWEKFNLQFWVTGILLALSLTLITNGIRLLVKYKNLSD